LDIKKKLKYIKDKLSLIIICFLFFFYYLEVLDYGLPYFENFDETTHIKSINYFFGFFTYANQQIHEPIYAPFIHFILSGTFIFIKYIFFGNFNFSETVNLIYLNPNILFENVRLSSLLISTGSLVIFFSILKKLEINNFLITLSLISVSLSYLFMDISIVAGKNSVLLFFFLLQYYLFLIYYLNIEKLNLKSYFLFGFITSIAWGVNYWAATPGLYAVFLLHYKKFKLTQLKNLFSFFLIFLIFGIIFNFVVSSDNFLDHIFSPEYIKDYNYKESTKISIIISELIDGINLIRFYERYFLEFLFICFFITFIFKMKIDRNLIFLNFFLLLEPIILFAIADYSHPHLRYLGPSIFLIFITTCMIIKSINIKNNQLSRFLTVSFLIIVLSTSYNKLNILYETHKLIKKKFVQYEILENFKNDKVVFDFPYAIYRENEKTLNLYKNLLNKGIIDLNDSSDGKNNLSEIEKKIKIINKFKYKNIIPISKDFVFMGGEFIIKDYEIYFKTLSKEYKYYVLDMNKNSKKYIFLKKNYKLEKTYQNGETIALRSITRKLKKEFNPKQIQMINKIGSSFVVFNLN
tara:strand:- start:15890 stop:17623 length:1734 start_codon:yes stop_codon:yes gene_type:complete